MILWNDYLDELKYALNIAEINDRQIYEVLKEAKEVGRNIFIAGNGGSAALALHFACDLNKCAIKNWKNNDKRFRAISLVSETSYLTAISNDDNYQNIFVEQLRNLAFPKDILILISSSGNSKNIINAAEWAKNNKLTVIGFSGFDGGKLKILSDYKVHVHVPDYGICEDVHSTAIHYFTRKLREEDDAL